MKYSLLLTVWIVPICCAASLLLAGCVASSAAIMPNDGQRSLQAKECGEKLLSAIMNNDYRQFHECYEQSDQAEFTLARKLMTDQLGKIDMYEYLARMNTPGELENHVWRVVFSRRDHTGKEIKQDVLFRIISGRDGDKERIIAMGFL